MPDALPSPALRSAGVPRLLSFGFMLGAFALGTSENVIAGILPRLADAFAVPFLTSTGVRDAAVAPLLLIYGAACLAGNILGGRLADRGLTRALIITLTATGLALLAAALVGGTSIGAVAELALVGIAHFATFPPLNTWIATSAEGIAPDLAIAVVISILLCVRTSPMRQGDL